jgi:hypothetical protein
MTIMPGLENFNWRDENTDDLASMITDLIELANTNYLKYLAAAATHDQQQVWDRYHESFALEQDIDTLTTFYGMLNRAGLRRLPPQ